MPNEILATVTNAQNQAVVSGVAKALSEEVEGEKKGLDFLAMITQALSGKDEKGLLARIDGEELLANLEGAEISIDDIADIELTKATFTQILQLLEHLNGKNAPKKMPKFDGKLKEILQDEKILSEFKGVKNIKDLVKLSQKYELGLEEIKIDKTELSKFKKTFPKLEKMGFFNDIKPSIFASKIVKSKIDQTKQNEPSVSLATLLNEKQKPKQDVKKDVKKEQKVELKDLLNLNQQSKLSESTVRATKVQVDGVKPLKTEDTTVLKEPTNNEEIVKNDEHVQTQKTMPKSDNLKVKNSNIKHTINSFAQDFKEQVENYKPPVMKVQMALNPKNLGEMDVIIVNRGNNLQVNITSNTTAMNIFLQNQAEFKNSLVNMGFTNLEMNFSDQRQGQDQGQNKGNGTKNASEEEIEVASEDTILEIRLPNYV